MYQNLLQTSNVPVIPVACVQIIHASLYKSWFNQTAHRMIQEARHKHMNPSLLSMCNNFIK
jgi:hypothetical protein